MEKLTDKEILSKFGSGFDCSQVVLEHFSEKLNITKDEALKIAACFGGGMWHGETCGCVVGSLIALGIKYGTTKPNDKEHKDKLLKLKAEFEEKFCAKHGSCICKKILGHDLSTEEGMAKIMEEKLLETKCPKVVMDACDILEKML
jgi:C_GCAxxG_C_C family probable redox protein